MTRASLRGIVAVGTVVALAACGSTAADNTGARLAADGLDVPLAESIAATPTGVPADATSAGVGMRPDASMQPRAAVAERSVVTTNGSTVPASTDPITVGFLYADTAGANSALGATMPSALDPRRAVEALVAGINAEGGLVGRTLEVVSHSFDASASDYSAQANAACARFTEDQPVPLVIDFAFGLRYGMAACLAEHGVANFGTGTTDDEETGRAPLFASPSFMTSDRRYRTVVRGMHATGQLVADNRIGVLLEDCPHLQRTYERTVVPEIERLGLDLAVTQRLECTDGFAAAGPAAAAVQSAVLRYRSEGVDRVLIVSDYEQVVLLFLANQAESQGWRPGYLLSSNAAVNQMRANISSGQWPQLRGIGWVPGVDVDDPRRPLAPAEARCVALIEKGGAEVSTWIDTYVANAICSAFFFTEAALRASGGDGRGAALGAATAALGSTYQAPGVVDGATRFDAGRRDGPARVAPFAYETACSCLRYTGPSFAA